MTVFGLNLSVCLRNWCLASYTREAGLAAFQFGPLVAEWECDPTEAENRAAYRSRLARGERLVGYIPTVNYLAPMGR